MKPVEDKGAVNESRKPIRLPVMQPGAVLDPVTCSGGLALINDRGDANPRPALALSNGASWDRYLTEPEVRELISRTAAQTVIQPQADVSRVVAQEVARVLPAMMPPERPPLVIEHKAQAAQADTSDAAAMASAILELSETVNELLRKNYELEQRVHALEGVRVVTRIDAA